MAIIDALKSASQKLISRQPSAFFSSENVFESDLSDMINEVAKDILESADWQGLTQIANLIGDGNTEAFDKPDGYDRQLIRSDVQDPSNWVFGYYHCQDINEFMWRKNRGFGPWPGIWIIFDNKFQFWPPPAAGQVAQFPYVSNKYAINAIDGVRKAAFSRDDDGYVLNERLLMLGLVWRWRENKKLDYTGDQEAFMKAISEYSGKDKGSKVFRSRSNSFNGNFSPAWPWELG